MCNKRFCFCSITLGVFTVNLYGCVPVTPNSIPVCKRDKPSSVGSMGHKLQLAELPGQVGRLEE